MRFRNFQSSSKSHSSSVVRVGTASVLLGWPSRKNARCCFSRRALQISESLKYLQHRSVCSSSEASCWTASLMGEMRPSRWSRRLSPRRSNGILFVCAGEVARLWGLISNATSPGGLRALRREPEKHQESSGEVTSFTAEEWNKLTSFAKWFQSRSWQKRHLPLGEIDEIMQYLFVCLCQWHNTRWPYKEDNC